MIAPLHGGRTALEIVALFAGGADSAPPTGLDLVRAAHPELAAEHAWRKALASGVVNGTAADLAQPSLKALAKFALAETELGALGGGNGKLELVFSIDPKIIDGRYANNAWLQELLSR